MTLTFDSVMKYHPENERNFKELFDRYERIIPFIGAGLSKPIYPLWGEALLQVAQYADSAYVMENDTCVKEVQKYLDNNEYEEAASYLSDFMGEGNFSWELNEKFSVEKIQPEKINKALILLPELFCKTVISSNYDRLLERVYSDGDCMLGNCLYNLSQTDDWVTIDRAIKQEGQRDIIKLHGDCSNPHSRIFTKESYERVYGQLDDDAALTPFVEKLSDLFRYGSMLFLGCGLKHDRTVSVLKKVVGRGDIKHFAIMPFTENISDFTEQYRHLSNLHIKPIWYPCGQYEAVAIILEAIKERSDIKLPTASKQKTTHNLMSRNNYFTGREEYLEEIQKAFEKGDSLSITQSIAGLGGVGKTQIALEYAYRHIGKYEHIWWIDASTENTIVSSYIAFITKCGLSANPSKDSSDVCCKVVKDWLSEHSKWLFIFDNADFYEENGKELSPQTVIKKYLPATIQGSQNVLITSRNKNWRSMSQQLNIDIFSSEEAVAFLTDKTGQATDYNMKQLADELGYLPLALAQAAAYMNEGDDSCRAYLELFQNNKARLLKEHPGVDDHKQIVYTTWDISINHIGKKSSRQLLNLCAFFAPEDFSKHWFAKAHDALPSPLREEVWDEVRNVWDTISYRNLLVELHKYSLITLRDKHIAMHRLLQVVIKESLGDERQKWAEYSLDLVNGLIFEDFSTVESRAEYFILWPHISSILDELLDDNDDLLIRKATLYAFAGKAEYELGNYAQALTQYKISLTTRKQVLGEDHIDTAATYNDIAAVYSAQEDYEKAFTEYKNALKIRKKVFGKKHPGTATTYNGIALVFHAQDEHIKALTLFKKALKICVDALGKEHPDIAAIHNNIALTYYTQGNYKKALIEYMKASTICENVPGGKEHPNTATTYNNIGMAYCALGKYGKAIVEYRKALAIRENILGKDHPDTIITYDNLSTIPNYEDECRKLHDRFSKRPARNEKQESNNFSSSANTYLDLLRR